MSPWRWVAAPPNRALAVPLTLALALAAVAALTSGALARLTVVPPEGVIDRSSLVLAGKVIESRHWPEERSFTVLVGRVLKGSYDSRLLTLTVQCPPRRPVGWAPFVPPPAGSEALLFLRRSDGGWMPAFDLNCIALVENARVTGLSGPVSVGLGDSRYSPEDYVRAYDAYLQDWLRAHPAPAPPQGAPAAARNPPGAGVSTAVGGSSPAGDGEGHGGTAWLLGAGAALLLAALAVGLVVYRRRRRRLQGRGMP